MLVYDTAGSSEGHSPVLNLSKTGGDHSGPASDHSAGGHTNVDDEDDLDEDDDNISDGDEDDIKDHGIIKYLLKHIKYKPSTNLKHPFCLHVYRDNRRHTLKKDK